MWLDCWEMNPGHSLVEKIWNEGLKRSDVVIIVLSKYTTENKWVQEELNTAFVKKVNGQTRLIPVRLDGCDVPECLLSTLWKDVPDPANYDQQFAEVVNAVFGHCPKPPLGKPPSYAVHYPLPGLEPADSLVLQSAYEAEIATGLPGADGESFLPLLKQGLTVKQIAESQEILHGRGFIRLHRSGGDPKTAEVTLLGFERCAKARIPDLDDLKAAVGRELARRHQTDNRALADALGQPLRIITHVLSFFSRKGWIRIADGYGVGYHHIDVLSVSPELKRWLESLSLLSGYKSNRTNWLAEWSKFSRESEG